MPVSGLGDDRYWQQLVITLAVADAAADEVLSIGMPSGLVLADTDGDGLVNDEVRVVYEAVATEQPGFFTNTSTNAERIVLGSVQSAAQGLSSWQTRHCRSSVTG